MMTERRVLKTRWPLASIAFFLVAVSVLSVPTSYVVIHSGNFEAYDLLADRSIMWCPAVAALLTCGIYKINLRNLGLSFPNWKFVASGYIIPLTVFSIAYAILGFGHVLVVNFARFSGYAENSLHLGVLSGFVGFALVASIGVIMDCAATIGEEIGWRGFLVPALAQRMSYLWVALISGLIWAVWHYPMIFASSFGRVGSVASSTVLFTIDTMLLAFIMAWLRLKSGSIWPTVVFHASNNTFSGRLFEKLPVVSGVAAERISKILVEACVLAVILIFFSSPRRTAGKAEA